MSSPEKLRSLMNELRQIEKQFLDGERNCIREFIDNPNDGYLEEHLIHANRRLSGLKENDLEEILKRRMCSGEYEPCFYTFKNLKNEGYPPFYHEWYDEEEIRKYQWFWEMSDTMGFSYAFLRKYGGVWDDHRNCMDKEMNDGDVWFRRADKDIDRDERVDWWVLARCNIALPEFFALSVLNRGIREGWEKLVLDIVNSRLRTPLGEVAKVLGIRLPAVAQISRNHMSEDDTIIEDEMIYVCKDPDFGLEAIVELPESPDFRVVYLIVCPSCNHRNEQGRTTCINCGAPL